MPELRVEASNVQGRLTVTDVDGVAINDTVPYAILIYDTQIRIVINDGPDVMIERGVKKTRFYVHPHEGDPIVKVVTHDDYMNKKPIVHLNRDKDEIEVKRDL